MSRYPTPREFDAHRPLEVRVWFRWAGRDYEPGQPFNWKQLAISARKTRQLFEMGKLKFAAEDTAPEPTPTPSPAPDPIKDFDFDLGDDLDDIDSMDALKAIAEEEGAPIKRSKVEQRDAIREHRNQ